MKFTVTALLAAASCANAHYIFQQFSAGSTKYPVYKYIRYNTNYNSPVTGQFSSFSSPEQIIGHKANTVAD
jgi:hypothetical protein